MEDTRLLEVLPRESPVCIWILSRGTTEMMNVCGLSQTSEFIYVVVLGSNVIEIIVGRSTPEMPNTAVRVFINGCCLTSTAACRIMGWIDH
jgi:hypothetical protein